MKQTLICIKPKIFVFSIQLYERNRSILNNETMKCVASEYIDFVINNLPSIAPLKYT